MKYVKLFEAFVNEGKVDPQTFTDEVVNMRSQIEEDADYAEMSDGNMAYFLDEAWEVIMEQINFHDQYHTLNQAFIKAKVKIEDDFHGVNMKRDAKEFAKMAYDLTNYSYTGAVECFMAAIKDTMSLSNSQLRSIEKYLNNAIDESVVNEKLSKSELNKIEDFLYDQDVDTLREICDELLVDDEDYTEDKYDLDSDDLVRMAMDYIDGESIKLKDVKAMV